MEALTKDMIAKIISDDYDISKRKATHIVDDVFRVISAQLKLGGKAEISGFGKFQITNRCERCGINPITKEKLIISESKLPTFRASSTLKKFVQ